MMIFSRNILEYQVLFISLLNRLSWLWLNEPRSVAQIRMPTVVLSFLSDKLCLGLKRREWRVPGVTLALIESRLQMNMLL